MPSIPAALSARFRIGSELWKGSSGVIYDATETSTGRVGVLKIVTQATAWTPAERGRLARELEKQTTLTHPYLASPMGAGIAEDVPWIFRAKVEGDALSTLLAAGPVPAPQAITITAQLAAALDELHRAGLLQRDLSPSHVIVGGNGTVPFVRLIDSGVATRIPGSAIFEITGKPPYVSPEHAAGKLVSFRSDLYALGSILFEMLTGRPLFAGTIEQILEQQRSAPPPSLAAVAPNVNVPGAITTLLGQLLAKEPRERPFSAQQVRRTLEPLVIAGGLAHAQPPAPGATSAGGMKKTLIGVASPVGAKRADGTEELSSLDLETAAAALRPPAAVPPAPRREETMQINPADLIPSTPRSGPPARREETMQINPAELIPSTPRSVPPPPPSDATMVAAPPRASAAPPPPPEKRASIPSAPSRQSSSGGLAVPPPPPGASTLAMSSSPTASSPGGLSVPPAPPPPAPVVAPTPVITKAAASDLDYDDLAETNAVSREEFEERQVTHRAQAINDLAPIAPPAGAFPSVNAVAPVQQYPATQMQPMQAYAPPAYGAPAPGYAPQPYAQQPYAPQGGAPSAYAPQGGAPSAYAPQGGAPSPFGPTTAMPAGMGAPMPGTQMMPMGQPMPVSARVDTDDVPGLRSPSRSPFVILAALVAGCFVFSLAGFGGYVLMFGRPAAAPVAAAPVVAPVAPVGAMQPMMPAAPPTTIAPVIAPIAPIVPMAPVAPPPSTATPTSVIAPLPPSSVAAPPPAPTPLVAIAPVPPPEPAPAPPPEPSRGGSRSRPSHVAAAPPPPPPPATRSGSGMLASRIGPAAPTAAPPPTSAPAGSGRLASRLGAAPPASSTAPASGGGGASFEDLRTRARTAFSAHHYDEAAQAYEQAARLQPSNAGIYAGLGAARLAGGNASAAVQAYQHAVQLQPSSAGYHAALGRAYATAGDRTHARQQYEEALRLDPANRDARAGLDHL
jgi:serine/threonine-protein kinase